LKKVAVYKKVRKVRSTANGTPIDEFKYQTILDTGTEWTVVGGPGWIVTQVIKRSLSMSAVDEHMGDVRMKLCDAVTAVADESGKVQLIGVKRCGYSPTLNDNEAVLNTNLMREAGMKVDACAKRHGATQKMILSANEPIVPLQYDATAYKMYVQCRAPTQKELRPIPVNWIDCHIEDLLIDDGKKQSRDRSILKNRVHLLSPTATEPSPKTSEKNEATMGSVEEDLKVDDMVPVQSSKINWRMTLGCSTPDVVSKTLRNTTQYFATPVESETRAYPRQHRQKRLVPLHLRRIPGRYSLRYLLISSGSNV